MSEKLIVFLIIEFLALAVFSFVEHKIWWGVYFISSAVINYSILMMGK